MLTKGAREDAILALIDLWVKEGGKKCGWCGEGNPEKIKTCTEGKCTYLTNAQMLSLFMKELNEVKATRANEYASTKNKSMRLSISLPPDLYYFLDKSFMRMYKERLFRNNSDIVGFMKKFKKHFTVPQKI